MSDAREASARAASDEDPPRGRRSEQSGSVPLVFVSVGTDHHPFDRLIGWVDAWLPDGVRCVVQHGESAPPRRAEGVPYLEHGELVALLEDAVVVACHGGPTTITESRRHGRRPIVVPRSPRLGEHVDDHQERFCARMAAKGLVSVATEEGEFRGLLDRAVGSPEAFAVDARGNHVTESVARFAELVDGLLAERARQPVRGGRTSKQ